ncbi:MAG TPA: S-methyl-5-thioribose-1-phosphate isomerase [Levilinea sp.]|nr:S-methyl-5-thioribose-1-phosphate isomerase [Levilinea sp.]
MRTIQWDENLCELHMIDQRVLPGQFKIVAYRDHLAVAQAIREMVVRGAPAIGVAAAYGMALAALRSGAKDLAQLQADLEEAGRVLVAARPTAVNLSWAVQRMLAAANEVDPTADELRSRLVALASQMADEDVAINRRMSEFGASLIQDGDTIIHHCNTGALAVVDWGTALGVIRMAHEHGKRIHVLVDETRPRLQGARLTAWELKQYGIPFDLIADGAAGYFIRTGQVQKVLFGADRVASNGDVANKIGSYMLALAAYSNQIPVYSVFPTSTVDLSLASGDLIPIEERDPCEVLDIQVDGEPVAPLGITARNPAFDVTPGSILSGLITEEGVVYPPFSTNLPLIVRKAQKAVYP